MTESNHVIIFYCMKTLKVKGKIDSKGHLKIDLQTPLTEGDVEIVLVIQPKTKKRKYDFSDIAGKLKWEGDALKMQNKLRHEWE